MISMYDLSIPNYWCCHQVLIGIHYATMHGQVGKAVDVLLDFTARGSRNSTLLTHGKS